MFLLQNNSKGINDIGFFDAVTDLDLATPGRELILSRDSGQIVIILMISPIIQNIIFKNARFADEVPNYLPTVAILNHVLNISRFIKLILFFFRMEYLKMAKRS